MSNCISYSSRLGPATTALIASLPLFLYSLYFVIVDILRSYRRNVQLLPTSRINPAPQCLACWATSTHGGRQRGLAVHSSLCSRYGCLDAEASVDQEETCPLLPPADYPPGSLQVRVRGINNTPSLADPSTRLTNFVLMGTSICTLLQLISLFIWALLYPSLIKDWSSIKQSLLPIFQLVKYSSSTVAWILCTVLLHHRRSRWDRTWVVAGFWVLASALGLMDLYDHTMYWIAPTLCDDVYASVSLRPMLSISFFLNLLLSMLLLLLVILRFRRRSELARAIADRRLHRVLGSDSHEATPANRTPIMGSTCVPGTTTPRTRTTTHPGLSDAEIKFRPPSSLHDYIDKLRKLSPYLWPNEDRYLQCLIIFCGFLLIIGRVVNVLLPLQYKSLVDVLTPPAVDDGKTPLPGGFPWISILTFVFLRFLQGTVGLVSTAQDFLWIPVGQFTTRAISLRMFTHLHSLSHRFHLTRKTGEILRVQDRGVSSIMALLSAILFNIVPTLVDIVIAVAFFAAQFDVWFGLIVLATMIFYIFMTVRITERRTKFRRKTNLLENAMQAKAVDSLLNFETVKFYNAEQFEAAQYAKAMAAYQKADWKSSFTSAILNVTQNTLIQLGLLAGTLLCAHRVAIQRSMSVGDFVLFISFLTQLYGPLNYFGTYYKQVQKNFVDMEKMLDLLTMKPEVQDPPDTPGGPQHTPATSAPPLATSSTTIWGQNPNVDNYPSPACTSVGPTRPLLTPGQVRGHVVFENVSFAYDPRMPTLRGISFEVEPGKTVALVGPSGSGKSTILRLLFRFYDVQGGRITIDGVEVRTISQKQLRALIAVVPQDCVLFNDTLRYNIKYGRVTASDAEVEEAAKAAQIHDRILTFPDQYETKCGERGMRLSGGEKQRVAIARTLLKNPVITLLDEATSALDTSTERMIQTQLRNITKGRTTLIIAHRLSTVVHADTILVVRNGVIVERGAHDELMEIPDGVYRDMWQKQLRNNQEILTAGEDELSPLKTDMDSDDTTCNAEPENGGAYSRKTSNAHGTSNLALPNLHEDELAFSQASQNQVPKMNLGACKGDLNLSADIDEDEDDDDEEMRHERQSTGSTNADSTSEQEALVDRLLDDEQGIRSAVGQADVLGNVKLTRNNPVV